MNEEFSPPTAFFTHLKRRKRVKQSRQALAIRPIGPRYLASCPSLSVSHSSVLSRPLQPFARPRATIGCTNPSGTASGFRSSKTAAWCGCYSRHGAEYTDRLPGMAEAFGKLPTQSAILDGELVVIDPRGYAPSATRQERRKVSYQTLGFNSESEPMHPDELELERAYNKGLTEFRQRSVTYSGSLQDMLFLLPLAVKLTRPSPSSHTWPTYSELSPNEQLAVRIIYCAMHNETHAVLRYPKFLGPVSIFGTAISTFLAATKGMVLTGKDLLVGEPPKPSRLQEVMRWSVEIVKEVNRVKLPNNWWKKPATGTSGDDPSFFEWLDDNRDPDLWHLIVRHFNYDAPCAMQFCDWAIEQPECDKATAALIFILCCGESYIGKPTSELDKDGEIIAKLVRRSEGSGFARNELSLSSVGEDNDQRPLLKRLQERPTSGVYTVPIPTNLLSNPFDGRWPATLFAVDENIIQSGIQFWDLTESELKTALGF